MTIREPSRPPRVLAWNVAADLDLTQLAPPISPHASVHALLYACGLEAFELAEGALPEGTALEPPGAVVRYEHASRMWSPRATADALSTIEAESELRFDLDPCPAYAHVATATTGWSFDEPWLVALFDDVVGLGTPGGHFATYSNGRLHREPNQQLACAWGNGVEAWALDVDGCPGRLAPPHTFTRDLELPCNTMVATGRCVGLLALPGSTELVAATRPAGVARMDRNEWRELVDPRTFLPPARGFFALDRRPSEILFAYRHAFDGIGFTMSWTDGVSTEIQLPMAIEDTYAITALASDDFIIGAQGPGLVTLYQYRSGALTRIGEITQELITALAPARAGFLAVTTYGVRHFASGRECGLWPIEDAWRAVETTSGIVVLRRSGESVELVELHRTRPARGCFPRELARPSR
ncbi:hypothetical protein L6R52_16665 [Myxococcota bacterium]|nr:hypothetical protein [Myxococcota bacterium]